LETKAPYPAFSKAEIGSVGFQPTLGMQFFLHASAQAVFASIFFMDDHFNAAVRRRPGGAALSKSAFLIITINAITDPISLFFDALPLQNLLFL
jgi:hypothetical protein